MNTMLAQIDILSIAKSAIFILLPLAGSVLLVMGIFQVAMDLRGGEQRKLMERLEARSRGKRDDKKRQSFIKRDMAEALEGTFQGQVAKLSIVPKLQTLLDQAAVPWSAPAVLINVVGLSALSGAALFMLKAGPLTTVGVPLGVLVLPFLWLRFKRKRRLNKMLDQLPDVFELLGQALRAGHSLASGIQLVSENMPDPIGTEFARVFHEQNLGIKIEDALKSMAERNGQMDLRFFVTAVLIQRQTGGDLAEVLDNIGGVIRERIELFGTVQALTAEGRLSGWVLLALPIIVFCAELYLNPDYAGDLLWDETGRFMLYAAAAMQLMGMAMIKKIVNIKV